MAKLLDGDEPVVGEPEDERCVAAPAERVAVRDRAVIGQEPSLLEIADQLVGRLHRGEAVEPAVLGREATALVDGREDVERERPRELEVLGAAARSDVDDPRARVERDLVPRDDAMLDGGTGAERVERALVAPPDELRSAQPLDEALVGVQRHGEPVAALGAAVLRLGVHRRGDVRGERPGSRRPDHDRLAVPVEERKRTSSDGSTFSS